MNKATYRKHHKWLGIIFCFFMLMFAVSGLMLNHRHYYGKVNVSRGYLPKSFQFHNFNNGLLRSSLRLGDNSVLVYGAGGIFLSNTAGTSFTDFNKGISPSADSRNIRSMVMSPDSTLFALAPYDFYIMPRGQTEWQSLAIVEQNVVHPVRFTDLAIKGDTLVVLSRSNVYISTPPYKTFQCVTLKASEDADGKVSLFRTIWMLHSGELFGIVGKVIVDLLAILFIFFCLSGIIIWLTPKWMKRRLKAGVKDLTISRAVLKFNVTHHERLGKWTIILTLGLCITGWMLRPPMLIALVKLSTPAIPYSALDNPNPWNDKLRMIVWDETCQDWLLSTSNGFYSLKGFDHTPHRITDAPAVSVMGLNVLTPLSEGQWMVGSFSGLFVWDRVNGRAMDYYTHQPAPQKAGTPFGNLAISGFSADFKRNPVVATWNDGVLDNKGIKIEQSTEKPIITQPEWMRTLPISAWALALEVHTGRIYTFLCGAETLLFVFIAGLIAVWILYSGWKIRKRKKSS